MQLSDRQAELVRLITSEGLDPGEAGRRAGFASNSIRVILRKPAVALAIHEALQYELRTVLAPLAFKVASSILKNPKASERVRADIAFKYMDRAGFITPTARDQAPQKALSEMSRDELLQFIDRNQAAIDKVEQELAERATEVSAPRSTPDPQVIDANPLSFLD